MRHRKHDDRKREMPVREDGQVYACVTKMLGNGRVMAACSDGVERMCKIRGSMRRREWVHPGDAVLVALRDFQDTKADLVYRYQDAEVQRLKRMGEEVVVGVPAQDREAQAEDYIEQYIEFEDDEVAVDDI